MDILKYCSETKDGCLEWQRARNQYGYGVVWFEGRAHLAHRIAYMFSIGEWPKGNVLHSCDNPACCNFEHLREGTQKDNMADRIERRGHPNSLKTHCPKGHPYDKRNTLISGGRRYCRACKRERRLSDG